MPVLGHEGRGAECRWFCARCVLFLLSDVLPSWDPGHVPFLAQPGQQVVPLRSLAIDGKAGKWLYQNIARRRLGIEAELTLRAQETRTCFSRQAVDQGFCGHAPLALKALHQEWIATRVES
jgi:hypothetical protein